MPLRGATVALWHVSDKGREAPELTDIVPECGHPVFIRLHILGIVQCFKNVASLTRSISSESSSFLMIHVFDLVLILER